MLVHKPSDATYLEKTDHCSSWRMAILSTWMVGRLLSSLFYMSLLLAKLPEQVSVGMLCMDDGILQTNVDGRDVERT